MFELNIATLPNSILYLEGVQLSYIKVYVHIFNLWYSNNPCFISNAEFVKRTGLHRDTIINAIQFFEKHGILKRVQKGTRRYLIQISKTIEIEPVDKSEEICSNNAKGSELDLQGVGVRPFKGSELDHHNNKINNKSNKSSLNKKPENDKKHDFAQSMDQMANEKKHIEQHEEIKKAPMSESCKNQLHELTMQLKIDCKT